MIYMTISSEFFYKIFSIWLTVESQKADDKMFVCKFANKVSLMLYYNKITNKRRQTV